MENGRSWGGKNGRLTSPASGGEPGDAAIPAPWHLAEMQCADKIVKRRASFAANAVGAAKFSFWSSAGLSNNHLSLLIGHWARKATRSSRRCGFVSG